MSAIVFCSVWVMDIKLNRMHARRISCENFNRKREIVFTIYLNICIVVIGKDAHGHGRKTIPIEINCRLIQIKTDK